MIMNVNNGNTSVVQNTKITETKVSLIRGGKDRSPIKGRKVASKMNGKILHGVSVWGCVCGLITCDLANLHKNGSP